MKVYAQWAGVAAAVSALAIAAQPVLAQDYPNRPVRLIVPFSAGGATDVPARIMAQKLAEQLGQQIVVDNRPGAGGLLGTALAAQALADGYTLLMTSTPFVLSPHMYEKLTYDPLKDFVPITQFGSAPNVLVVHPALPAKSIKELIALAQAQPGKIDWASSGTGGGQHLFGELFMALAKVNMTHIPHKGSAPAMASLIGGQVRIGFPGIAVALPHHKAGRLRALGVTTAERSPQMPDVPSIAEAGVAGYEATFWLGLSAPTGTSKDIIARLHKETTALLKSPDVKEGFARAGTDPAPSDPQRFRKFILSEYEKWGKLIREQGIKPS